MKKHIFNRTFTFGISRKALITSVIIATSPLVASPVAALASPFPLSVFAGVGTTGIFAGAKYRESQHFSTVAELGGLNVDPQFSAGGENYSMDIHLLTGLMAENWQPWTNGFYLTAGVLINGNSLSLSPAAAAGYYALATPARVTFNPVEPYFGVGYSRRFSHTSHWSFDFTAGAAYQGTPKVSVTRGAGPYAGMARSEELASIKKQSLSGFGFYPVVQTGIGYHW